MTKYKITFYRKAGGFNEYEHDSQAAAEQHIASVFKADPESKLSHATIDEVVTTQSVVKVIER